MLPKLGLWYFQLKKTPHPPLILNNEIIPDVTSHSHLGTILSNDLTWLMHINTIYEKALKD
jgi:hypothetical protein